MRSLTLSSVVARNITASIYIHNSNSTSWKDASISGIFNGYKVQGPPRKKEKKSTTAAGFEPARQFANTFRVYHLNHSVKQPKG